jgi:hypothetical protein
MSSACVAPDDGHGNASGSPHAGLNDETVTPAIVATKE